MRLPLRALTSQALLLAISCDGAKDAPSLPGDGPGDTAGTVDTGTTDSPTPTDDTGTTSETCYTLADGSCVEETWVDLPELAEVDGVHSLTFGPTEMMLGGRRHCGRAYNGVYPGPTLVTEARQGSTPRQVRIDLRNTFSDHDYHSLDGDDTCECRDSAGAECMPAGHGGCDTEPTSEDCACTNSEGDACEHMYDFNLTNLHAHGSHVWPDYARGGGCLADGEFACRDCEADACDGDARDDTCFYSDDVLTQVHPATGARYRWDLDEDGTHHAGLNWYHPHIHGTTAIQVASGAAGAWIIRGDIDEVPGIADARERTLVFTTPPVGEDGFVALADGEECTEATLTFNNFVPLGATSAKQLNLLNGVQTPRMVTPPGQVERWRFLNAGHLDESFFGIFRGTDSDCTSWSNAPADTMELTQYARDGITMPAFHADPYWFMSSGYRVEGFFGGAGVLVEGDTWCLVAARFLQEGEDGLPVSPAEAPTEEGVQELLSVGSLMGILNVTATAGSPTETVPPTQAAVAASAPTTTIEGETAEARCAEAAAVEEAELIDEVAILQVGIWTVDDPDPCECDDHNVNCRNFGEVDRSVYPYDRDLEVGEVAHWRVSASTDGHPFHIHINPFLACPSGSPFDPVPFPHWRDTYLVNLTRKTDFITQYNAFTGAFVFHCHKLTHEDDGMMQILRVCDPATDATCGDYGWRQCAEGDLECVQALAATDCAIEAANVAEAFTCITLLGLPDGVCGENACGSDADCPPTERCEDYVCSGP